VANAAIRSQRRALMPASGQPARRQIRRSTSARRDRGRRRSASPSRTTRSGSTETVAARSIARRPAAQDARRGAGQLPEADQGVGDLRVILGGELRQQVVADAGPGARAVVVGGVVAIVLADGVEVIADLPAPGAQRGAQQRDGGRQGPPGRHARQPAGSGPPEDAMEDRLGLVVAVWATATPEAPRARATSSSQA
jgi:hypothetical protein